MIEQSKHGIRINPGLMQRSPVITTMDQRAFPIMTTVHQVSDTPGIEGLKHGECGGLLWGNSFLRSLRGC